MTHPKRSTARRSSAAAAGLAVAALLLAACGGGSSESTSSAAPAASAGAASAPAANAAFEEAAARIAELQGPTVWPEITPLSKAVDVKGKNVLIVPIGDAVPVIQAVRTGLEQGLTKAGATPTKCDGKFNPTDIATCLKQAVDRKFDAVVTLFIDYAMVPTAFDEITAAGIPVLVGGVSPTGNPPAGAPMAFMDISQQNGATAAIAAEAALASQGADLKALVGVLKDSEMTAAADMSIVDTITSKCPECAAPVTVEFTTPTVDKLPSAVSAALVANAEINAYFAAPEAFMDPAVGGITSSGKTDQVKLYGTNGDLAGLQRVKDGKQVADAAISPIYVGWQVANGLMQLLAGDEVTPLTEFVAGRVFTAENVGDLTLTPEEYFTTNWYNPDTSFQDAFLAAWSGK